MGKRKKGESGAAASRAPSKRARHAPLKNKGPDWTRGLHSVDRVANVGQGSEHPLAASNRAMFKRLKKQGTLRSYNSLEVKFRKFCQEKNFTCVPVAPDTVIAFMNLMLEEGYARSTICSSAMGAIAAIHKERDVDSPTTHPRVIEMKKIITTHTPCPRPKKPMTHAVLEKFILVMDTESKLDTRDLFLFELMLAALLRESEAMNLLLQDVQIMTIDGKKVLVILVETSKTDQGTGDCIIVEENLARPLRCVVSWFLRYLEFRGVSQSPFLFVPYGT